MTVYQERVLIPAVNLTQDLANRGRRAQDHRASRANVWRRRDNGETVEVCAGCGCETDLETVAHDARCKA